MSARARHPLALVAEPLGTGLLLLVLCLVIWVFGTRMLAGIDEALHHTGWPANRTGIELAVVPLIVVGAARCRRCADRFRSLRWTGINPYLPLLMAASLVGLITYLVWSWATPLTLVGPDEFGFLRWLGTALAAAFAIIWLPLFPRITATLAGVIAGPTLIAVIGYAFFASQMPASGDRWGSDGPGTGAPVFSFLVTLLWLIGALFLSYLGRKSEPAATRPRPLSHSLWSGGLMVLATLVGLS